MASRRRPDRVLELIALFKLLKAALLVAVGLAALDMLRPQVAARAHAALALLAMRSDRHLVQAAIAWTVGLSLPRLEALGIGALLYAGLFTIEGFGLWRGRPWAEWLTVIATALFVPLEAWELTRRVSGPRLVALLLNLAVVLYLLWRLRRPSAES